MAPAAQGNDPPKTPPTATTTAAPEPDNTAPAALVPLPPGYTLGPLVVNTVAPGTDQRETFSRTLVSPTGGGISCRGRTPGEALALTVAEAWEHYFSRHPKGLNEAARLACKRPHPAPTGGLSTTGPLADRHTFQFPVCLADTPEVVTVAGTPRRFNTTMRLEAVGQDWDGRVQRIAKLNTKPIEMDFLFDPDKATAEVAKIMAPVLDGWAQKIRDDVAAHSRAVMEAATRARAAVPPEPVAPYNTIRRTEFVAVDAAHCDPAAAVRNVVWPAGWYDGKICSRYTSRTYTAADGRTPGMSSTFTHTGPQCDY